MQHTSTSISPVDGVILRQPLEGAAAKVLTTDALEFLAKLHRAFDGRRLELLNARRERAMEIDKGAQLDFRPETADVRSTDWHVADAPHDLVDRRVEITGPVDRKMVINALNSGANVFMADFEYAASATWKNMVEGQLNLSDAVRREIDFTHPTTGKEYALAEETATLVVRPRGWHLPERHVEIDGVAMSGSLFDFGLYFFHNAHELLSRNTGPYFYLPKLESHLEARLWNEVFCMAQDLLDISRGTIRATVLIETIHAAFEMDEILYEQREHSSGLNCGRWDYIFSTIKTFRQNPNFVVPDRGQVGMLQPFLRAYSQLLIRTCHRRGAHAMGGMAAQIPIKHDTQANERALAKVRADKAREAQDGHDGTWVAHPALVAVAKQECDSFLGDKPNQLDVTRDDVNIVAADLVEPPTGSITEEGLRQNIDIGLRYLAAWLSGNGCVPLHNLMEDAATAEISRIQVWQWVHHHASTDEGKAITLELVDEVLTQILGTLELEYGVEALETGRYALAAELMRELVACDRPPNFLTSLAYPHLG